MHFYTPIATADFFSDNRAKSLLFGSDGGWGNFGDIAQHKGTIGFVKEATDLSPFSVLNAAAFAKETDFEALRKAYGSDALLLHSWRRLDAKRLGLEPVAEFSNVQMIHVYGGGFLNEFWGEEMLTVAELFLSTFENAKYVISGQQISKTFIARFLRHVKTHRPSVLGVRDWTSHRLLRDLGQNASFSFDDATEFLLQLRANVRAEAGEGLALHLNFSNYTGAQGQKEVVEHLRSLHRSRFHGSSVTAFQAYQDERIEVVDTLESIKSMGSSWEFAEANFIFLGKIALQPPVSPAQFEAEIGYSSSYHVALWLQLQGLPCWVPSFNSFYDQKAVSLGVTTNFSAFLQDPTVHSHNQNLELRASWLESLRAEYSGLKRTETKSMHFTPVSRFGARVNAKVKKALS